MADLRQDLDVKAPTDIPEIAGLIDTLPDDFSPFTIEEDERRGPVHRVYFWIGAKMRPNHTCHRPAFGSPGVTNTTLEVDHERWAESSDGQIVSLVVGGLTSGRKTAFVTVSPTLVGSKATSKTTDGSD